MAEFSAHYERKLSDGNYGSEGLSLSWTWTSEADNGEDKLMVAAVLLHDMVLEFLSHSAAERVAYAAKRELKAPEREARIRESAETEYAAGIRDIVNAGGDDDLEDLPY